MSRPTNADLCQDFRRLLTEEFFAVDPDGVLYQAPDQPFREEALAATKPWRGKLWRAFRELEDRLCPTQKFERTGEP